MTSPTEIEFSEYDFNNSWNEEFHRLKNKSSLSNLGEDFTTTKARDPDNRRKNRYRDVSPYDHSRVFLSREDDYINASLIQVPEANRRYILTQGPLDHTMGDFWQMTWEQESRAIIMLNRVIEKGTLKCSQYWPLGLEHHHDNEMYFPECGMRVTLLSEQHFKHFTLRSLGMEKMETGENREVLHFHYTTWPDFGVPSSPNAFLHFLHAVRQMGSLDSDVGPAIIHCSAGIGRSGTFCLVDSCLIMVEEKSTLDCMNVKDELIKMRYYRMGLIQTADQLRFSYLAIIQGSHVILSGQGLSTLEDSSCMNANNVEGLPPPPPERVSSLQTPPTKPPHFHPQTPPDFLDLLDPEDTQPPPLPPKQHSPDGSLTPLDGWGDEEVEEFDQLFDFEDEEFDKLIDREEDGETTEEEEEDPAKLAEEKRRIREQRKIDTMEKIRQMKEKQRNSDKCHKEPFFGPKLYFGLAILVGVAGVVIYKYFW